MDALAGGGVKVNKPVVYRFHNGDGWRYYIADGIMRTRAYRRPHHAKAAWDRGEVVPVWDGDRSTWGREHLRSRRGSE